MEERQNSKLPPMGRAASCMASSAVGCASVQRGREAVKNCFGWLWRCWKTVHKRSLFYLICKMVSFLLLKQSYACIAGEISKYCFLASTNIRWPLRFILQKIRDALANLCFLCLCFSYLARYIVIFFSCSCSSYDEALTFNSMWINTASIFSSFSILYFFRVNMSVLVLHPIFYPHQPVVIHAVAVSQVWTGLIFKPITEKK